MKKLLLKILNVILDHRCGWGDKLAKPFDVWLFKTIVKLEEETK